jgi:hypothetical protein
MFSNVTAACFGARFLVDGINDGWLTNENYHIAWFPIPVATFVAGRILYRCKDRLEPRRYAIRFAAMCIVYLLGLAFSTLLAMRASLVTFELWFVYLDCTSAIGGHNWWAAWTCGIMISIPGGMLTVIFPMYALEQWRAEIYARLVARATSRQMQDSPISLRAAETPMDARQTDFFLPIQSDIASPT